MRIINVVKVSNGVVDDIESYGVFEEQLVDDVVKPAEEMFIKCAKEIGYDETNDPENEDLLDNGYFENVALSRSVCITWSDI
jgi:hypothetical protein